MKRNPNDNYYTTDNEMILEDGDTGEQYIFLIDRKNMLVIRSFFEEDINPFILNYDGVTSKERKAKKSKEKTPISGVTKRKLSIFIFCD